MKLFFLLISLGLTEGLVYAQPAPNRTIRGSVTDADTRKPIPFGNVSRFAPARADYFLHRL